MIRPFILKRRRQLVELFYRALNPTGSDVCLEIGGPTHGFGDLARGFRRMILLNLDVVETEKAQTFYKGHPGLFRIRANGCSLPFPDKAVDYVLSNATLEHVPPSDRTQFAREVSRVSRKGYFVSTPNFWFPLEPHYWIPGFQFLPEHAKKAIVWRVQIAWMNKDRYEPISLLTTRELRALFPEARIVGLRFLLVPETLVAFHRFT